MKKILLPTVSMIAIALSCSASFAQEDNEQDEQRLDTVVTTGTRIKGADQTLRSEVFTAEDIRESGRASLEEFLRTLPQNQATLNQFSNANVSNPNGFGASNNGQIGSLNALGLSAANLGGVGVDATLILIDGRRVAGAAGVEAGFVNLNNIPLGAIDRIEIIYDGASSVYGADAIGGVINIITKKDYSGIQVDATYENSQHDGDFYRASIFAGKNWSGGSISGTFGYSNSKPVNVNKAGWTTQNFEGRTVTGIDGQERVLDSRFDFRSCLASGFSPAAVCAQGPAGVDLILNESFAGGVPTPADFRVATRDDFDGSVDAFQGPETDSYNARINFQQKFSDAIHFDAFAAYNESESNGLGRRGGLISTLPFGHAYNPFTAADLISTGNFTPFFPGQMPTGVRFSFSPRDGYADGSFPLNGSTAERTGWEFGGGLEFEWSENQFIEFDANYSKNENVSFASRLGSLADPSFPFVVNGSCFLSRNFDPSRTGDLIDPDGLVDLALNGHCPALTSDDPNVAFNPFGEGGYDPLNFFVANQSDESSSELTQYTLNFTGQLFDLPGGAVNYAVGGEISQSSVNSLIIRETSGVKPETDEESLFAEVSVPIFGEGNRISGFHYLLVSGRLRYDKTTSRGAFGSDAAGDLILGETSFDATSPSASFIWYPHETFSLRGSWNKGFIQPVASELFQTRSVETTNGFVFGDPFGPPFYFAPTQEVPNPDLEPTTSDQYSLTGRWTPSGALDGLDVSVTWSEVTRKNDQISSRSLRSLISAEEFFSNPFFFERDPATNLVSLQRVTTINLARAEFSSIEYRAQYEFDTQIGDFVVGATYIDNKKDTQVFGSRVFNRLGRASGNLSNRWIGNVQYNTGAFSGIATVSRDSGYIFDIGSFYSNGMIANPDSAFLLPSTTKVDLTLGYAFTDKVRGTLGATNITNAGNHLALTNGGSAPWDPRIYNPRGRVISFGISAEF